VDHHLRSLVGVAALAVALKQSVGYILHPMRWAIDDPAPVGRCLPRGGYEPEQACYPTDRSLATTAARRSVLGSQDDSDDVPLDPREAEDVAGSRSSDVPYTWDLLSHTGDHHPQE
jgi:hypothetical protein